MTLKLRRKFPTFNEELTEPGARSTQPRLDGPQGDPFSLGGLLVGESLDIAQHHDDALIVWERQQTLLDHADGLRGEGGAFWSDLAVREAGLIAALLHDHV